MSKIKKIFAVLLTLAMVMGMNMTTFAAEKSATITIKNAGAGATFEYIQVIEPDTKAATGWKFSNNAIATAYLTAYEATDAQAVIQTLIDKADAAKTQKALDTILSTQALSQATKSPFTVKEAGVYAIKGTEVDFAYSSMAAYVSFKNYDPATGVPQALENAEIEAKKVPTTVVKTSDDDDKVVEIGREVEYNITTTIPYIAAGIENPKYIVTDTITGAVYAVDNNGKLQVSVKNGANEATVFEVTPTLNADGKSGSFTLDLSTLLEGNKNANNSLIITYKAIVKDVLIGNTVNVGDGTDDTKYGKDSDKLVTGEIKLTKTGENNAPLNGAEFVVYKEDNGTKSYAKFDNDIKFVEWVAKEEDATRVVTNAEGIVNVYGLDNNATYKFKEVKAPEGYSINATDSEVTWGTVDAELTQTVKGTASMTDTKLSSLPGTGGIGTTIFTIGGCIIMIIAAALFFASRKKSSK